MSASQPRPAASFPERIGRYDLLLPIASGGMATVYLSSARGPMGFEAEVAIKLTHPHLRESAEFSTDLLEEAKLAVRIRHRNVAAVIDADVDPLGVYLVMEYVEGDTLAGLSKATRPLPTSMGLRVLIDALAGLHAAHELRDERGEPLHVVHRDFTPHNILVGTDGVARLTDFGIAKAASRLGHTRTGLVKGKIGYMAPEQARGMLLDRRCDVWAAGVIAWELLARRRLYPGDDDVATLLKVATERPARLRTVEPSIHPEIEETVHAALDPDVELRCPSALAFARQLGAACRAHLGIAEPEEVAEWLGVEVGPKLAARRETLARVKAERASASSGNIPRAAASDARAPEPPPPPEPIAPTALAVGARTVVEGAAQRTVQAPTVVSASSSSSQPVQAAEEPTRTDASSVITPSSPRTAATRPRQLGIALGLAAVAVVGAVAALRGSGTPSAPSLAAPSTAAAPSAIPTTTPTAAATTGAPAPSSSAWTPIPVTVAVDALPEMPAPSASAPRPRPAGRPAPAAPRPRAPAAPQGPAPLAPSPY